MKIKTNVKAGGLGMNHSDAVVVRSAVTAGGQKINHSES